MQYKNILVAINIYEDYHHTLQTAERLAQKFGSKLTAMMVLNAPFELIPMATEYQKSLEEQVITTLNREIERLDLKSVKTITETGAPHNKITGYSNDHDIDLIVLGSHGTHGLNLLLGSTSNSVLHQAPCDVLTVRLGENKPESATLYNRVLLATDMDIDNHQLVDKAKILAEKYEGSFSVVNVQADPTVAVSTFGVVPAIHKELHKASQEQLTQWCQEQGLNVENNCIMGESSQAITEHAKDNGYNLIIVGSHHRSAIGRFFLGSTANATLHHSDTDVLVVRLK